jgi:hypothetical protein
MASLREKMAQNGFESNDDYEFQVRCLLEGSAKRIRTLSIEGDGERRKTAFATALAASLDFPRVLYHDFSDESPPQPEVVLPDAEDDYGRKEPPIEPLDDIASHACALSEAEPTILILDQLQMADFREHIRIHRLIRDRQWLVRDAPYYANTRNLVLFLISEEPLYHALQRASFRVWVSRFSERRIDFRPDDFGLDSTAAPLFNALADLFRVLDATPTRGEFTEILGDLTGQVQTETHLRHVLYGRCEGIDRERVYTDAALPELTAVIEQLRTYLGGEQIVIGGD